MPTEKDNDPRIAVRCENCKKILASNCVLTIGFSGCLPDAAKLIIIQEYIKIVLSLLEI